jgi:hypothetical protein
VGGKLGRPYGRLLLYISGHDQIDMPTTERERREVAGVTYCIFGSVDALSCFTSTQEKRGKRLQDRPTYNNNNNNISATQSVYKARACVL